MLDSEAKLRADAKANRDRILDVAREALAADPAASLNMIAKTAGVGAGTLYRHFPTREALLVGVYRKEIDAQVALAPVLLKEHPPLAALRLWCDRFIQFGEAKYGIAETFHAAISDQDLQEVYKTLASAIGKLINACEQAGTIQPGTRAEDVLTLLGLLLRVPSKFGGRERARRILDIMFRGLSA